MKIAAVHVLSLLAYVGVIGFLFCSADQVIAPSEDILPDIPANVFVKSVDSTSFIVIPGDPLHPRRIVADQVLIMVDTALVTESDAEHIASAVNGTIVGKIPPFGFYQVEFAHLPFDELEIRRAQLAGQPGVLTASYNRIASRRSPQPHCCVFADDLHDFPWSRRAAFENIGYSEITPLITRIRRVMPFHKVVVGLFDSGLSKACGQFDNIRIHNLQNPGQEPVDEISFHGTQVGGIIAADNGDGLVNGIASRVLEEKLEIVLGSSVWEVSQVILHIFLARHRYGMTICNMSFGYGGSIMDSTFIYTRTLLALAFRYTPDVLYVAAAANEPFELDETNDAPAGIRLPNVITVGGTAAFSPERASYFTSWGPLIDIAAPAESVLVIGNKTGNVPLHSDGNSFATPMVTSLAAILKSIAPALSPGQIKEYICANAYPASARVGGRRLYLPVAIQQVLIDRGAPADVIALVDGDGDGVADAPGLVSYRICGGTHIDIENFKLFTFLSDTAQFGNINAAGLQATFIKDESTHFGLMLHDYRCVGQTYSFSNGNEPGPTGATLFFGDNDFLRTLPVVGNAISGSVTVDMATIRQRNGYTGAPLLLDIEGTLEGVMEILLDGEAVLRDFVGRFLIPVTVLVNDPELIEYLELNCRGGRRYGG